jgi:diguanylate cyclase (GGDEF)-like protein
VTLDSIGAVQLTLVVVSLVFSGACYLGWLLFERPRHALIWTFAYLLAALQYGLNLLREEVSPYELWWLLVNAGSGLLVLTATLGHRVRLGLPSPPGAIAAVYLTLVAGHVAFTLVWPRMDLRVSLAPAFACAAFAHVGWILWRHGPEPRLAQQVGAVVHLLFALAQGAAALIALQFGVEATPVQRNAYNVVNFALMPTFFVAMGITAIFLLGTDLATRLRLLAVTDSLTGLCNRRGFLQVATRMLAQAQRHVQPVTLVIADLDYFKRINDRYGHSAGDRALAHFARTLSDGLRGEEVVGRLGGEEFSLILFGGCADARQVVSRLRERMLSDPLQVEGEPVPMSASFGMAQWEGEADIETLLMRADRALYQAKEAGRDTVVIAPSAADASETLSSA